MQTLPVYRKPVQRGTVRGTQSLVHIIGQCWHRPGVLAREVAWRWLFGIPALLLLFAVGKRVFIALMAAHTGIENFSLADPMAGVQAIAETAAAIEAVVLHIALWLTPLLAVCWAVASGLGRGFVLRAIEPRAHVAPFTLILLQLVRIAALSGSLLLWFASVRWAARATLFSPEPNLVGYFALVICLSLGMFTLWALLSWIFAIAPLLAVLENRGIASSIAASARLGPLTGKLVEINLVLGIVKLALVVLAMVFSATPLPFESVVSGTALYVWWIAVSVLYLIASDYFQVARLAAFVEFWRTYRGQTAE